MKVMSFNKKAKGFSLIELMLVLVVLVVLIGGAYVLFNTLSQGAKSDQAQKNLMGLQAGVKRMCTRAGQCPTLAAATVISAGQAPSDMINGTNLQSPWGGAVTVVATGDLGGTDNAFDYTFNAVPKSECNTFVSAVQNNFGKITIGGTAVKDVGTPFVLATAVTQCEAGGDNNTIVFTAP